MHPLPSLLLLLVAACSGTSGDLPDDTGSGIVLSDADGDGFAAGEDCDDGDGSIHPSAVELCDGTDNNCDESIDEGVGQTFYLDNDGDGFGNPALPVQACSQQVGYALVGSDCDDSAGAAFPGGQEVCDGLDNDCDGADDEGTTQTWYVDYDGDGYGDLARTEERCDTPGAIYVLQAGDCDDLDVAFRPGAAEGCDGRDYNCDGAVDSDADGDGYADAQCGGDDCDDADSALLPEVGGGCAVGRTCLEILEAGLSGGDGVYGLDLDGFDGPLEPQAVYCDMTRGGGGWTLLGKTEDPTTLSATQQDTVRKGTWEVYTQAGYGDPDPVSSKIFWVPLAFWHELTALYSDNILWIEDSYTDMRVRNVGIANEASNYTITWEEAVSGYDALHADIQGNMFTTYESARDNDGWGGGNCAKDFGGYNGGFWYGSSCNNLSMLSRRNGLLYSWADDADISINEMYIFFREQG